MIQMQLQLPLLLFQHMMIPFLRTLGVDEMNLRCCIRGAAEEYAAVSDVETRRGAGASSALSYALRFTEVIDE